MKIVQRQFVVGLLDEVLFEVIDPEIGIVKVILLKTVFFAAFVNARIIYKIFCLTFILVEVGLHSVLDLVVVETGLEDTATQNSLHVLLVVILAVVISTYDFLLVGFP